MATVKRNSVLRRSSGTLWEAWFSAATSATEKADSQVRQQPLADRRWPCDCVAPADPSPEALYRDAARWFKAAAEQSEDRHATSVLAFAGRAWTMFQLQQDIDAESDAWCALRHWKGDHEPTRVVRRYLARSHYILGELALLKNDTGAATERIEDALEFYGVDRETVDGAFDASDIDQIATASYRLGILVFRRNEYERAIVHFLRARRLLRQRANADEFISTVLSAEAVARIEIGQLRAALTLFEQWQVCIDCIQPFPVEVSRQARVFGYLNLVAGRYRLAGELFQHAAETLDRCCPDDSESLSKLARHQARYRKRIGDYAGALDLLDPAGIAEDKNSQSRIRELNLSGEIQFATGAIADGQSLFETAEKLAQDGVSTNISDRVETLLGLSRIRTTQGMFRTAEDLAEKAIGYLERQDRSLHPEMAQALLQVSNARFHRGVRDSGPICDEAIDLLSISLGHQSSELPDFLLVRANIHWSRAEIDAGLTIGKTVYDQLMEQRPHDRFAFARLETVRGKLFHMQGNLPAARACLADAWNHWNQKEKEIKREHPEKSETILALATLFVAYGDYPSAEQLLTLLSHAMLRLKANVEERFAYELNWQGNIYFVNKHFRVAEWLYRQAAAIYERVLGDDHEHTLQTRENQSKSLENSGILLREVPSDSP